VIPSPWRERLRVRGPPVLQTSSPQLSTVGGISAPIAEPLVLRLILSHVGGCILSGVEGLS
jgi:hypothetical protein